MLVIGKSKPLKSLVIPVLLKARKKASTLVPKKVWMTRGGKNILTTVWINPRQEEKKQIYQYGLFEEPQYGLPREKVVRPPHKKKPVEKEEKVKETILTVPISKTQFRDYGAWKIKGSVSQKQRMKVNQEIARLLNRPGDSLTKEEIDTIRLYSGFGGIQAENEKGVLYDYYTSPPVAKMTYQLLNKIAPIKPGSSLLEPSCGTGVFFEVAPEGVELHGVELDKRTATAASLLQEKAKIYNSSFEEFNLHSEKQFDHVIGNAPFGERGVSTGFVDLPGEKSLDRYFISRSLDNLKPGGTMAMIVHPGVMDNKMARDWRMEMLKKGQFVGAVRLPDKSFKHTHTGVNPDIVFFKKHPEEVQQRLVQLDEAGLKQTGFFQEGWVEGTYYEQKSKHILGTKGTGAWQREIVEGTLSLQDMDNTINLFQPEPGKSQEDLQRLMQIVREPVIQPQKETTKLTPQEAGAVANKTLLVGMTKTVNGKVYILNENHRWELLKDVAAEEVEKLTRIKKLSNLVKQIRDGMHRDEPVDELQKEARTLIEEYETDYEVSHIEDQDILRILRKNPALSQIYEGMSVALDSALLTRQNVFDKEIEIKDGHNPAVLALLELQKRLKEADPETLRAFFPNRAGELLEEMYRNPDIYLDTEGRFHLKEDYLSGNAWEKIDALNQAIEKQQAQEEPDRKNIEKWRQGVQSLKEAIGWIPIEDADIKPYSNWIPKEIVNRWVQDPNGMGYSEEVWKDEETGKWETAGWAKEIIYFLNLQKQRSKHIDTETYNQQAEENWRNWLANNQEARKSLEELYNRKFNGELGIPTKTYAVDIEGWNPNVVLKPHQWQSVHHLYRQGKGISALGVGFGKTYSAIGLIALLRQEGKIKRPFLQVPNNKVKDWVEEFGKTMPGLKLGYVDPEEEGYGNRLKRYARYQELANIDYDAIILPESAAVEIQLRPQEDERISNEVISAQTMSKEKKTERQKQEAEERVRRKLAQQEAGKNKTIDFEDLGCDAIFVDEAHNHKNLFSSSLSRETGMNDGRRSERALSLFKKNEYMRKEHDGKNVFFLTATPLTNSPLEYYNMLMHVAPEEMQKFGIYNIDQFIREFADIQEGEKYDWSSGQIKSGRVLKGFKNLQTLRDMFFKYTDLQNDPERIGLEKPKANFMPNKIDSVVEQRTIIKELSEEIEHYRSMSAEEREAEYPGQNFLTFYSKMRTASLDLQLYDPVKYKDWENPKLAKLVDNVYETYKSRGGGQVIFCDRVLSGDCSFNLHEKIKKELLDKGFSEKEIVVVNGITKAGGKQAESALEKQVSKAIEGFNEGKYKVIVGTTHTLGEGVNLQKNSSALHHFDIPYRPSDFIQRNGRIDRQGNVQEQVTLHTYLSAGTIDNYSVSLVQGKANWIDQLLKTKSTVFMNPNDENYVDIDGLLLALTEEFEDVEGAGRLKQEIAKRKEAAVKLKKQNQAHEMLAQLALMRGALKSFVGDKGSAEYQARLRKISHLESALEKNPEFKHPELLTETPPSFMYDTKNRRVYKIGDHLIRQSGLYRISSFDFKRNEFGFQNIDDPEDVHAWSRKSGFGWSMSGIDHLPNVKTKEDIDRYRSLFDAERFKQQDAAFKKTNYRKLLQYTKKEQKLPYFYRYKAADVLKLGSIEYSPIGLKILNPFDETDQKEILGNLKSGNLKLDWNANLPEAARVFGGEIGKMLYEGAFKAYRKHPESKMIDETISEQWQPLENFVKKVEGKMSDEYEMEQIIGKHPEYEVKYSWDIEGMKSSHRKMARKRPKKVGKSIPHFVIPLLETDKSIKKVNRHVLLK